MAKPTIARSTAVMSASTALSRVTGFVRTWAIAYALGVTLLASSYAVANNIPNMIFELVAGGIITSLFIPIFLERWDKDSEKDAWRFASSLFNLVTIIMCVVAVAGTFWAEAFVRTQTFRISPEEAQLATYFFRFFAVQVVFYGSGSIISAILNSQRRFFWPAIGPVFNNLVVIVTLLGFYVPFRESDPDLAITGLAIGTTLGVFTMFAVQVPSLLKLKPQYSWRIDLSPPWSAPHRAPCDPDDRLRRHEHGRHLLPQRLRLRGLTRRTGDAPVRVDVLPTALRHLRGRPGDRCLHRALGLGGPK